MKSSDKFKHLKEILRQNMAELKERYHIRTLGVFGSYIHQAQQESSDLDLLVEFEVVPSLFEFLELKQHLSDLLGVEVDLVMKDALKPTIGRHILEEVILLTK